MWNKRLNKYKNNKDSVKNVVNLLKHYAYIKLRLALKSLKTLKIRELLLTANSQNLSVNG